MLVLPLLHRILRPVEKCDPRGRCCSCSATCTSLKLDSEWVHSFCDTGQCFLSWKRLTDCSVLWGKKQRWLTVLNTLSILWVCEMQMKSNVAYLSSTFYVFVIMPTVFICMPTVIIILHCRLWNKYELMPQLFMSAIIKESTGNAGHNQRCLNQSSAPSNSAPTLLCREN